jgi:hypothetical protein
MLSYHTEKDAQLDTLTAAWCLLLLGCAVFRISTVAHRRRSLQAYVALAWTSLGLITAACTLSALSW